MSESDARLWIDPETRNFVGPDRHHRFTEAEVGAFEAPACPACGARADVRFTEMQDLDTTMRMFLLGRWYCVTPECDSPGGP